MNSRALYNPLNGRLTMMRSKSNYSYEDAKPQKDSNYWSATENNSTNAWNVNFSNGNVNNNNKNNSYVVRPVTAHDGLYYSFDRLPEGASCDESFLKFFETVHIAYLDCLRRKMSSSQALEYMQEAWIDLPYLAWELWSGTYTPSTSTCFLVRYPKLREVFAANFRDRIVHHWICIRMEPLFEERFVSQGDVSFNCRKGFGTDRCVKHCADGMKEVSDGFKKPAWIFKGDISGFFMSINKKLLWYLLSRFITRWRKRYEREGWNRIGMDILDRLRMSEMPEMYWDILIRTVEVVVMHHPENDCVLNSPVSMWNGLAPNKSLFGRGEETGEPIGNLTTQLFANFYMSFFDSFVLFLFRQKKHSYERFVDDWDNKCDDKEFLLQAIPKMEAFLLDKMKLKMHKAKRYIQPVTHGISLVGAYIKPGRIYLSNRTLARFMERAVGFRRLIETKEELSTLDCKRIEQVINSYLGFCKDRHTYRKRKEIIGAIGNAFYRYFYVRGHYKSIRVRTKYKEIEFPFELAA